MRAADSEGVATRRERGFERIEGASRALSSPLAVQVVLARPVREIGRDMSGAPAARHDARMDFAHIPPEAPVLTGEEPLVGLEGVTVRDFWSWGMSDLRTNTLPGVLAEFIVSRAVGSTSVRRDEWDAYDVVTPAGLRVEVKAAAYLQGWSQPRLTDIRFGGLSARLLDEAANTYVGERGYNADVYCFCVQTATSHDALNVLDLSQWAFYVASREAVAATGARSLSLATVERISIGPLPVSELADAVAQSAHPTIAR